jgi:hypothetical protein
LDITTPEGEGYGDPDGDGDRTYHPILLEPAKHSSLFHPSFDSGPCHNRFEFYEIEDLEVLLERSEKTDERWERMLACVPAVQKMNVALWWRNDIETDCPSWHHRRRAYYTVEKEAGVTVWDLVEVVRKTLWDTERVLKSHWLDGIEGYRKLDTWERHGDAGSYHCK